MALHDDVPDLQAHPLSEEVLLDLHDEFTDWGVIGFESGDQRVAYEAYWRRTGGDPYPANNLTSQRLESHWCACGRPIGLNTPSASYGPDADHQTTIGPRRCIRCYERAHPQEGRDD
jgi:hypothetical protein